MPKSKKTAESRDPGNRRFVRFLAKLKPWHSYVPKKAPTPLSTLIARVRPLTPPLDSSVELAHRHIVKAFDMSHYMYFVYARTLLDARHSYELPALFVRVNELGLCLREHMEIGEGAKEWSALKSRFDFTREHILSEGHKSSYHSACMAYPSSLLIPGDNDFGDMDALFPRWDRIYDCAINRFGVVQAWLESHSLVNALAEEVVTTAKFRADTLRRLPAPPTAFTEKPHLQAFTSAVEGAQVATMEPLVSKRRALARKNRERVGLMLQAMLEMRAFDEDSAVTFADIVKAADFEQNPDNWKEAFATLGPSGDVIVGEGRGARHYLTQNGIAKAKASSCN